MQTGVHVTISLLAQWPEITSAKGQPQQTTYFTTIAKTDTQDAFKSATIRATNNKYVVDSPFDKYLCSNESKSGPSD